MGAGKMESTLLTLDVENRLMSSATWKNGGWTVFQRRRDGSEDFYRNLADYVAGFGNITREFWLGLNHIHCLTSAAPKTELRVNLADYIKGTINMLKFLLLCWQQWNKLQTKHSRLYRNCWTFTRLA